MEYFDVLNEDGTRTGKIKERNAVHRDGDWHGSSRLWVARQNKTTKRAEVLLQKRCRTKDVYPGLYDVSTAGHLSTGDDFLSAAVREAKEELGLTVRPEELVFLRYQRVEFFSKPHGISVTDREIHAVYFLWKDVEPKELHLQAEEVESVKWMDADLLFSELKKEIEGYCIPLHEYQFVYDYIQQLDKTT